MIAHAFRYPAAMSFGAVFAGMLIIFSDPLSDLGSRVYDVAQPVVTDWHVISAAHDGDDLVLTGTMIKRRNCTFVPPTLARDREGRNYAVISAAATAGKTWAASDDPQQYGPWRVVGGAGKRLTFLNVYLCGRSSPSVVELGVFGGTQ
jgi:hypothetical protein